MDVIRLGSRLFGGGGRLLLANGRLVFDVAVFRTPLDVAVSDVAGVSDIELLEWSPVPNVHYERVDSIVHAAVVGPTDASGSD